MWRCPGARLKFRESLDYRPFQALEDYERLHICFGKVSLTLQNRCGTKQKRITDSPELPVCSRTKCCGFNMLGRKSNAVDEWIRRRFRKVRDIQVPRDPCLVIRIEPGLFGGRGLCVLWSGGGFIVSGDEFCCPCNYRPKSGVSIEPDGHVNHSV